LTVEIRRAYSICSSQKVVNCIAIKAVKKGVSQFANTKLKVVGQALEVGEPEGKIYI
jgi:ferredoxin-NADP reductase